MFEILGYLISLIIISVVVTILVELSKKIKFTDKLANFFTTKVKKLSWYQVDTFLISVIVLIVLNILGAVTLGIIALILNAIIITLLSNGIFTYGIFKYTI